MVLVSGIQQSDSAIYIYVFFFFFDGVGGNSAPLFFLQNLFEKISWTKVRNRILGSSKEET